MLFKAFSLKSYALLLEFAKKNCKLEKIEIFWHSSFIGNMFAKNNVQIL